MNELKKDIEKVFGDVDWDKVFSISWWEKILLYFCKEKQTFDHCPHRHISECIQISTITYKVLFGKTYIIKQGGGLYFQKKTNPDVIFFSQPQDPDEF